MSRTMILAIVSIATVTACAVDATIDGTSAQQALEEAEASAADAKATAEACFSAFEACREGEGADVEQCRTELRDCLPAEAHPGPRCGPPRGKGKGHPRGPSGECDGGARPSGGDEGAAPPPPPPGGQEDGDRPARPQGEAGGQGPRGGQGGEPPFCKKVPLPPREDVEACRDALGSCLEGGEARETCFDAHRACMKAAFDAAKAGAQDGE